jgi:hypothetical protein
VHGVRFSIVLPGRTFARNSLVRVRVSATNISGRPIQLSASCRNGGLPTFFAGVLNGQGRLVYAPPPVRPIPEPPCTGGSANGTSGPQLRPGQTLTKPEYIILRGAQVAAILTGAGGRIVGRALSVRLTHAPAARLVFSRDDSTVTISPGRPAHGPPLIAQAVGCAGPGAGVANSINWYRAGSRTIHPACRLLEGSVVQWHIVAGWPDQPVGEAFVSNRH